MTAARARSLACLVALAATLFLVSGLRSDLVTALDLSIVAALRISDVAALASSPWVLLSAPGAAALTLPLTAVGAVALWVAGARVAASFAFVATAGGYALMYGLKALVSRSRPILDSASAFNPDTLGLAAWDPASLAFPSGHAMLALTVYGYLASSLPPRLRLIGWALALAIASLVGGSRVAVGAHWPSDVLGGWLVGAAWLGAVLAMRAAVRDRASGAAATTSQRLP